MSGTAAASPSVRRGAARWFVAAALVAAAALAWTLPENDVTRATLWRTYRVTDVLVASALSAAALASIYVGWGPGETRRRVFRVVLVTASLGFCLLVGEAPAAVLGHDYALTFGTRPADTWLQVAGGINRRDPELIHLHKAHDTWEGEVAGNLAFLGIPAGPRHRVSLRYDANGFRNDRDLDRADVVAIGDSFVEAAILPRERTVCARLEETLGVPVANLGQEGYGLRQELAVLRRFALPLRPRLVLWFLFGGNDLRDVEAYEAALRAVAEGPPVRPLRERALTTNSLLALSALTTPALTEPSTLALDQSAIYTRSDGIRERIYFGAGEDFHDPHSWDVATETLAEADRLCRDAGAKFVVVYVTRKFRVYRRHVETKPATSASTWDPGDLPDRLAAWTAERSIPFVDPTAALEREVAAGRHTYLPDDVHWNELGHDVAAREVAAALAAMGWRAEEEKSR